MNTKLPLWFRQDIPDEDVLASMRLVRERKVHTVCQQAHCPNISGCLKNHELTFMILGDTCTRSCLFCAVTKSPLCRGEDIDFGEPEIIASLVREMDVEYVVITSVSRDDLFDGGAEQFARTIRCIKAIRKDIKVEVLIPDFRGERESIKVVSQASPSVIGHNLETVKRLSAALRPQASYERSLSVLAVAKETNPALITKSSLMLGLGETKEEVVKTMQDLRQVQCDIVTLGQYLAPSLLHYPVQEFVSLPQFDAYREIALSLGFRAVLSQPKARSSYNAKELYRGAGNA